LQENNAAVPVENEVYRKKTLQTFHREVNTLQLGAEKTKSVAQNWKANAAPFRCKPKENRTKRMLKS
jgi:hypothetical protein